MTATANCANEVVEIVEPHNANIKDCGTTAAPVRKQSGSLAILKEPLPPSAEPSPIQTVDEFKDLMYKMQSVRRRIVCAIMNEEEILDDWVDTLRRALAVLCDCHTHSFQREMSTNCANLSINIKDETIGLKKDLQFLSSLSSAREEQPTASWLDLLAKVDLISILAAFYPFGETTFRSECEFCIRFLRSFVESNTNGRKPIFITDWDGTMKDYCSQYATNLQPIYSAVGMSQFAARFTRLSAVLTAGPLRGPGILDLTAMPIDGPVLFSGSWGREWWLGGRRVVHDDGISEDGFVALQRLSDEMAELLHTGDYSQFALVGSGVQRKVDRITLGVQTVCGHVQPELSTRYQDAVRERMHRVDPGNHVLVFDPSTELEVEVVAHNSGAVWNKADGVDRVVAAMDDSLETDGRVLICGDTTSDLPMVRQACRRNPQGVMALFVGWNEKLRQTVRSMVRDEERCCFVSCPDVIHAAMASLLAETHPRD